MNIGDNLLTQNIDLFNKADSEEALAIMRYMSLKERNPEKRLVYLDFIDKLEAKLMVIYEAETQGPKEAFNHQKG